MSVLITNIQRYAIHDGGGIRTTVFFKGCPLACAWCHNPENISFLPEGEFFSYTPQELAQIVARDQVFFGEHGGVTISGGEPLAQNSEYMLEFLALLKKKDIHVACDTSGDVDWGVVEAVLPYVDLFLYDIKAASQSLHIKYTGQDNGRILSNLKKLAPLTQVWLRIPVIGGVNDGDEMQEIIAFAKAAAPGCKVSLLPYHRMGERKRNKSINFTFATPSGERMLEITKAWKHAGFQVE